MKTAKDTVMNDEQIFRLIASPEELKLLKRFEKASVSGEYHRLALAQAKITWDIAIKEVVDYIEHNYPIGTPKWQAQLKSWGVSEGK